MVIEPGRIINDFIEPNKRQYAIPVYQRNYEWSKEQCVKLFDDIVLAYKRDKTHFCGSVVYALLKEERNIYYYVIIDGQQRLTTIYLMMKAMLDNAQTEAERETLTEALFNKDKFDKFGIDVASKLKLKPIKSDNNQLALLMDNKYDQIDKSTGIWKNYELFCELVKQQQNENGLTVKEIYKGIEKLICAKIKLDGDENAQEIFERINSTGVPLSLADKIRNFVLMTDADQETLYENYWLKIEQLVKKDMMSYFFIDYLNMKIDGFAKESDAYDVFKNVYEKNKYTNETMLAEVLHYATYYHAFLYGDDAKYGEEVNKLLIDLQKLKQSTVFLFLFKVFDDLDAGVIDEIVLAKVLRLLLNYSIRRLICEVGSNSLRGLYKTLYARIFINDTYKQNYYDSIVSFLLQLTSKDAMPSDDAFILALKQNNLYRKNALCKYLLIEIENQGKEHIIVDNLSIEHIMPQNNNLSTDWQNMLGADWAIVKDKYLHTLGNLTLTGYNSELGDKPFLEKKQKLSAAQTKIVALNSDVMSCDVWNEAQIVSRAERLSKEILGLHCIEMPATMVSFKDPRYQEYTCEDPSVATYKAPNYFVLQGERINCDNFNSMVRMVIDRLYESDKSIIDNMCKTGAKLWDNSMYAFFSYDAKQFKYPEQIGETGIYFNIGYSASHCMWIIKGFLDKYEIEIDDFVYSARNVRKTTKKEENVE